MAFGTKVILLVLSILLVAAAAYFLFSDQGGNSKPTESPQEDAIHGCVLSAGYAWCESSQKCMKPWEGDCLPSGGTEENKAVAFSEAYVKGLPDYVDGSGRGLKLKSILQNGCPGCWIAYLGFDADSAKGADHDKLTLKLILDEFRVVDSVITRETVVVLTEDECRNASGRVAFVANGTACSGDELNVGEISGLGGLYACCASQNLQEDGKFCLKGGGFYAEGVTLNGPAGYCFFADSRSYCLSKAFMDGACIEGEANYKCDAVGTAAEGFYDTYTKDLVAWYDCG
ncbi:MAG: hypothetical protein JW727_00380 [Candidatus Aenigmarchaeota archaeon]|nr:hypothetical protein [Candidatus Aenigmarchaeota archaeon]